MIPAFRFNVLTIISSIIIFSDNAFSLIIPSFFIAVYSVFVRLFAPFLFGGYFNQGDIILALLSSGTLFCATFLIQWYGTIPVSVGGKVVLGVISGATAFAIIGAGTSPVGMAYTVLISNICCMIIRIFEEKNNEIAVSKVIDKLMAKMQGESK
ncbi:MAG: RnfABCDGE type electron transport complex subunit D [Treponema sp.]|nr:RnfABCDGE type electron transport complex subunit D [Treponema sp.]